MVKGNFRVRDSFLLNGRKTFLNSGEIHYFRIQRELWDKHLTAAREAGLSTVSTYVPWAWHEEAVGEFDFSGKTHPQKDLEGWLDRCQAHGLYCILKPGPFILAEWRGAGLPDWFVEQYGSEVKMRNRKGDIVPGDGVSLFHPVFLEKVTRWYDQVMPLIARREISAGGPVIMMQICNEIGVFSWLAHQADYGEEVKRRFGDLPPDGRTPYASMEDRGRDYEWHLFWRSYYGDYLRMLSKMARDRGVTVPFYHNLPGWIYGHGYEFPVNITMYEDLFGDKSEIMFGIDHIPEFVSYRNMHDDRIINDITQAMQGNKPLFAAEFQSGSREYHVVTNPRETELFYKASIAHGLTGWNYYMFSQGRNPSRRGYSGDTFYWFTPLQADGERSSLFPLVQRMSRIVKTTESIILEAERKAGICVLFYPPYYATELERPEEGASGLTFNYAAIRRPAYFDGLLKALQVLNIDYDMADLNQATADSLARYRQVWAFCTDEMNAREQQVLVDYTESGGNLVIFPNLPDREMTGTPSHIIRDSIPVSPAGTETIDSPLIDIFGLKDIKCANPQVIYDEKAPGDAEIIARTIRGSACGFIKTMDKGTLMHLGTWIGFDTEGHKPVYEAMLKRSGARLRQASSSNDFITVRERFTGDGKGLLFIGNYYNEEQTGKVEYTHPVSRDSIPIPYAGGEILWPPLYGMLTPLLLEIDEGLSILHSTSDILGIEKTREGIRITLYGDRDLAGEIVFEGDVSKISFVKINGEIARLISDNNRKVLYYKHVHNKEISLELGRM
ncbi:MAG: beta-galactosidase [Bacteroidales bacterium]|nr:beta-galactosidase [Bacteroidales bacterium]